MERIHRRAGSAGRAGDVPARAVGQADSITGGAGPTDGEVPRGREGSYGTEADSRTASSSTKSGRTPSPMISGGSAACRTRSSSSAPLVSNRSGKSLGWRTPRVPALPGHDSRVASRKALLGRRPDRWPWLWAVSGSYRSAAPWVRSHRPESGQLDEAVNVSSGAGFDHVREGAAPDHAPSPPSRRYTKEVRKAQRAGDVGKPLV